MTTQRTTIAFAAACVLLVAAGQKNVLAAQAPVTPRNAFAGVETIMKTKRTIVAIFHELDIVRDGFSRVILVSNGTIAADGTPAEVLTAERISGAWGIPLERAARL